MLYLKLPLKTKGVKMTKTYTKELTDLISVMTDMDISVMTPEDRDKLLYEVISELIDAVDSSDELFDDADDELDF